MRNRFEASWFTYLPFLDADGGGSGNAGQGGDSSHSSNSGNAGGTGEGSGDGDGDANTGTVTMTQAELDKVIQRRVQRAVKDANDKAKAEADKAAMTESERLKAEKSDLEKAVKAAQEENRRVRVLARAESLAGKAGVRHDRIDDVIGKSELAEISVDDDGKVDGAAITKAIEAVLAKYPEWKAESNGAARSGAEFNGNKRSSADIKPGVDRIRAGYGG